MYTETAKNLESETVKRSSAKRIDHLLAQATATNLERGLYSCKSVPTQIF